MQESLKHWGWVTHCHLDSGGRAPFQSRRSKHPMNFQSVQTDQNGPAQHPWTIVPLFFERNLVLLKPYHGKPFLVRRCRGYATVAKSERNFLWNCTEPRKDCRFVTSVGFGILMMSLTLAPLPIPSAGNTCHKYSIRVSTKQHFSLQQR